MTQTRRHFLVTSATAVGVTTFLPFAAHAAGMTGDTFTTKSGDIIIHPVAHASFVMETPAGTIYCDPVGDALLYDDFPKPDFILVTHEHGDHFNVGTLTELAGDKTKLVTNPAVFNKLSDELRTKANQIANAESLELDGFSVDAIPAYNTTEGRTNFHPEGRDNGYVLTFDGFRIYISGDTEDIPEMRALKNIDLAFICMNLPFTMDAPAAASAVKEFGPKFVYPYHYRGRDDGTQDPKTFAKLIGESAQVKMGPWYG